jgi:hypothetical protein
VNLNVVPSAEHEKLMLNEGDQVEIVTLVGGGQTTPPPDAPLKIGKFTFRSRLFTGTGKYPSPELMQQCMVASDCEVTTVAVRREPVAQSAILNGDDPHEALIIIDGKGLAGHGASHLETREVPGGIRVRHDREPPCHRDVVQCGNDRRLIRRSDRAKP